MKNESERYKAAWDAYLAGRVNERPNSMEFNLTAKECRSIRESVFPPADSFAGAVERDISKGGAR